MELLENLKWRYATKKYDSTKKVSLEDLDKIKEAIQLSATSYGLQLFKVVNVVDPELRKQLQPASWGQPQITDASHLLVFCNYSKVEDEHIDDYIHLKAAAQNLAVSDLQGFGSFVKSKMKEKSDAEIGNWTAKQTYIALSNALTACAELKIDSTPIEGFEPEKYNQLLNLTSKGLEAAVVLAIGYRSDEDPTSGARKVRKSLSTLFEEI